MFADNDVRLGHDACAVLKRVANEFLETGYHRMHVFLLFYAFYWISDHLLLSLALMSFTFKRLQQGKRVVAKDIVHFFWLEGFFLRYFLITKPNAGQMVQVMLV